MVHTQSLALSEYHILMELANVSEPFLNLHNLVALTSFFKKKDYGTGQHPRSRLQHNLDHMFVSSKDFMRFTNAETCRFGQFINIYHRGVKCCLRFAPHLRKKRNKRTRLMRLDYSQLLRHDTKHFFADIVVSMLGSSDPSTTSFTTHHCPPSNSKKHAPFKSETCSPVV